MTDTQSLLPLIAGMPTTRLYQLRQIVDEQLHDQRQRDLPRMLTLLIELVASVRFKEVRFGRRFDDANERVRFDETVVVELELALTVDQLPRVEMPDEEPSDLQMLRMALHDRHLLEGAAFSYHGGSTVKVEIDEPTALRRFLRYFPKSGAADAVNGGLRAFQHAEERLYQERRERITQTRLAAVEAMPTPE